MLLLLGGVHLSGHLLWLLRLLRLLLCLLLLDLRLRVRVTRMCLL